MSGDAEGTDADLYGDEDIGLDDVDEGLDGLDDGYDHGGMLGPYSGRPLAEQSPEDLEALLAMDDEAVHRYMGEHGHHDDGAYDAITTATSDIPIGDRLYMQGQDVMRRKQERVMKVQAEKEKAEVRENQAKPTINSTSNVRRSEGDFDKFYKLQEAWLQRKNRILCDKRLAEKAEQASEVRTTKASKRSNEILAGRYRGPVDAWSEREQHFRAVHTEEKRPEATFTPTISPAAQHLQRKGTASTRLYESAKKKQQQKEEAEEHGKRVTGDDVAAFHTRVQARNNAAKRKLDGKKQALQEEEGSYRPAINQRSMRILDRQGGHVPIHLRSGRKQNPHATPSEIHDGDTHRRRRQGSHGDQPRYVLRTHSPAPLPHCHSLHPILHPPRIEIWNKIEVTKKKVNARLDCLKEERRLEEKEECTFKPKTNSRSRALVSKASSRFAGDNFEEGVTFYDEEGAPVHRSEPGAHGVPDTPYDDLEADGEEYWTGEDAEAQHPPPDARSLPQENGEFLEWEASWVRQQSEINSILRQYTGGKPGSAGSPPQRADPPAAPPAHAGPEPQAGQQPQAGAHPHEAQRSVSRASRTSIPPTPQDRQAPPAHQRSVPSTAASPGSNFRHWEDEWQQQQSEIESMLQQYGAPSGSSRRQQSMPQPEFSPSTPTTHNASHSAATGGPSSIPRFTPPPASAPLEERVSDLQSVLDGWRQLEDQFSSSFEQLRLR